MPRFNTQFEKRAPVFQEPGSPIKVVFSPRYTEDGVLELVETGSENLYDYIQSHRESTDIHVLLTRFANGEEDVLSRMQGFYADVSDMPKTYAEVLNAVMVGEETFARLPVEVKQRFDNSFAVWLSSMDRSDFSLKMGLSGSAAASSASFDGQNSTPRLTPAGVSAPPPPASSAPAIPASPADSSSSI